jgi:hypothetical protein
VAAEKKLNGRTPTETDDLDAGGWKKGSVDGGAVCGHSDRVHRTDWGIGGIERNFW